MLLLKAFDGAFVVFEAKLPSNTDVVEYKWRDGYMISEPCVYGYKYNPQNDSSMQKNLLYYGCVDYKRELQSHSAN